MTISRSMTSRLKMGFSRLRGSRNDFEFAPMPKRDLLATFWDAESFANRVKASRKGSRPPLEEILQEIVTSNSDWTQKTRISVPETVLVSWQECVRALRNKQIWDFGAEPVISFSSSSVCDAIHYFASQDSRRVVCCVMPTGGDIPGGGYTTGNQGLEEDMCRRMPSLQPSLDKCRLYPFGPYAASAEGHPELNCNVLFSPSIELARGHEVEGFPILPAAQCVEAHVTSVVPPSDQALGANRTEGGTIVELDAGEAGFLAASIAAIFVAPVYKEPSCTTLIVGPWGCGTNCKRAPHVATYFSQALTGRLPGTSVNLGKFYHEVHFALPPAKPGEEDCGMIFRTAMTSAGIPFVDFDK